MSSRIHVIICGGALRQLLPFPQRDELLSRPVLSSYSSSLRRALSEQYGTSTVEVHVRPDLFGRMRLSFSGEVDEPRERERIWSIAERVFRQIFV
ncbi:MAG: hypothetical protein HYZ28_08040 [Myxococcales bacterium]|nr:hypothetical protein [Myxococcales bacterium]